MIERHITFEVAEGSASEFERFFADEYGPAAAAAPGNLRIELLREHDQGSRYQMIFRWASQDAALGWRTSPVHEALQPGLGALAATTGIVAYEVVG